MGSGSWTGDSVDANAKAVMQELNSGGGGGALVCYLSGTKPTLASQASMSKAGPWKDGGGEHEGDTTPTCAAWGPASSGAISWICMSLHDLQDP